MGVGSRDSSHAGLAGVAESLLDRREELAETIARGVLSRVPYYGAAGDGMAAYLNAAAFEDVSQMFEGLRAEDDSFRHVDRSFARGRSRAAAGVPLAELLKAHRIGGRMMWEAFAEEASRAELGPAEVTRAATIMWEIHDLCTQATAEGYSQGASEQVVAEHQRRSALLELLLRGPLSDRPSLEPLASGLRLPTEGPYVAIVTEATGAGENPMPDIEVALRAHGQASAWQLLPDALVGIVHLPRGGTESLRERLASDPDLRHGLSPVFSDLALAGPSVRLARIALTGTRATHEQIGVFDEQPVTSAVVSDPDVMRHIRDRVLGGLDQMPEDERAVLLDTLETWLDSGGSSEAAADALFCHPNTVRHRLRRLESATGRQLRNPRDVADLCLALAAERGGA